VFSLHGRAGGLLSGTPAPVNRVAEGFFCGQVTFIMKQEITMTDKRAKKENRKRTSFPFRF